jgi:hypothetical protein
VDEMLMKKIIVYGVIMIALVPWQALGGEKEQLAMAVVLVEKSRLPERFVDLAEAFMETYFERYDKPVAENPADGNPLKKKFGRSKFGRRRTQTDAGRNLYRPFQRKGAKGNRQFL